MKIRFVFTFNKPLYRWWLFQFIPFQIKFYGLLWKWKYEFTRVERVPSLELTILNCEFTWYFGSDMYWEKKLSLKHGKYEEWMKE